MKIVILCGGLGMRLREETEFRPKPMVNIGNRPIIWHIMKGYAKYGYNDFVLALGYKGELLKEYPYHYKLMNNDITIELKHPQKLSIHDYDEEDNWRITLADTGPKALKGARLKRVEKYIDGQEFMMTYGDGLANVDIHKLLSFHRSHKKLATVTGINPASRFGELKIKGDQVEGFYEKPEADSEFINGGYFIFNKEIFSYLCDDDKCDLEVGPLEKIAKAGQLMVYKHRGFWACMDNIRDMEYLNKIWNENKAPWKVW